MNESVRVVLADRYHILGPLGRGGMGAVWRARDTDLDRLVAVKELRLPDHVGEDERRVWYARMEREARAAARLRHPGIVTVYERVVGDDGRPWIVMELIQGGSLQDLLREKGRLPVPRVAAIGEQVLAALSAAHERGIVHRDIKPANVLLEGDRAVLTDFGIAALDGDATITHTGTLLGTPAFMAPEQVRGLRAGPRSDLWSLGATLYAAVEGHPPFSGPTHGSVFVAIATENPAPPVHAGPLTEVLAGLLRKDPAERLTADAVRGLLAPLAHAEPRRPAPVAPPPIAPLPRPAAPGLVVPPPDSRTAVETAPPRRWRGPHRTRTRALTLAAALVVVAGITAGGWTALSSSKRHSARTGRSAGATATPVSRDMTIPAGGGAIFDVAFDPDGRTLASAGEDGTIRLWDTATGRQTATLLDEPGDDKFSVVFSPDRRTLATDGDRISQIRLWETATHRAIATLADPDDAAVTSLAFSPDGGTLAVGADITPTIGDPGTRMVRFWDVRTRRVTATISGIKKDVDSVAFSPDGRTLAYTDDKVIRLVEVATHRVTATLTGHDDFLRSVTFSPDGRTLASSSDDHTIKLWNLATRKPDLNITGSEGGQIVFSPDGRTLAGRGGDDTKVVRLWDVESGDIVASFTGHTDTVYPVAFSPDGKTLAAGANDRTIRLWKVP
ncbi:serine/threonine protein kinase [Actinoallomurus sp. NBC_01490]|uniref:WD40 repeat domain-containing serine/threonine protein kinase n=1 Tax=Actinoallomurus sp. NBC_01490 TaxID=2903557 RepID=UPI002E319EC8|nr:serine/threonine-protein kinase [Actinoallomurus sp. NBC_01490]